jgi:hypothetical protein
MPAILWNDCSLVGLRRPWPAVRGLLDQWFFRMQVRGLSKALSHHQPTRIFALAGADPYFLRVANTLATQLKIPLEIYLVDDFEESAIAAGDKITTKWIRKNERQLLSSVNKIWVISEGFAEHLKQKHGLESSVLPVAMPPEELVYRSLPQTGHRAIAFVGSINHLYLDAIVSVYRCLSALNADQTDQPYRLAIYTLRFPQELVDRLGDTRFLELHLGKSDADLKSALGEALAVLLPYTFDRASRLMVSTSFSCKTGEALTSGRPVLVFGPAYASVPRHFLKHDLPLVVTSEGLLCDAILAIPATDNRASIEKYRKVTEDLHHPEAVLRKIEESASEQKI